MTVKLNIRDWPKRGDFMRREAVVNAADDAEAIQLGLIEGKQTWPQGKITAYDVVRERNQPVPTRPVLKAKAS